MSAGSGAATQNPYALDLRWSVDGATVSTSVVAPAKLNLALAVGARRADGYHELASVMQTIDLADNITVTLHLPAPGTTGISHDGPPRITVTAPALAGGDTLVTRAIEGWCRQTGINLVADVHVDKQIPAGAGMGGSTSRSRQAPAWGAAAATRRRRWSPSTRSPGGG